MKKATLTLIAALLVSSAALAEPACNNSISNKMKSAAGAKAEADAKVTADKYEKYADGAPAAPPKPGESASGTDGFYISRCISNAIGQGSLSFSLPSLGEIFNRISTMACSRINSEVRGMMSEYMGGISQRFDVQIPGLGTVPLGGYSASTYGNGSVNGNLGGQRIYENYGTSSYSTDSTLSNSINKLKCMTSSSSSACQ